MPIPQMIPLRRGSKALYRCLSQRELSKLIFLSERRRFYHQSSSSNKDRIPLKGRGLSREWNFALLGGMLILSYSYFTNYLSSDTITGIRQYTSSSSSEKSIGQGASSNKQNTISLLTDKEVTNRLRDLEQSYFVNRGKGVLRYDVAQLPSNNPIEDNRIEQVITVPNEDGSSLNVEDLYFFGIFDGHGGPYTSTKLSQDLVHYVAHQLGKIYSEGTTVLSSQSVDSAITRGFLQLDNDIVLGSLGNLFQHPTKENLINALPAISGSCALLAMFDSKTSTLKVATTGDSRVLMGSIDGQGRWTVKALSTDQTGDNLEEVARIRREHPDEPNCVRNGRVLGSLQPSRAFGDYRYKVKELDGKTVYDLPDHLKIYFRKEPRDFLTPPYVTAEPVITTAHVTPETKFMVMASDGLFELLSNEEIAGLVVKWMQESPVKQGFEKLASSGVKGKMPPVSDLSQHKESQRPAFRYKAQQRSSSDYLLEDQNVATHLIRNALSAGGNKEYVSTLVSIPSPMSRKYRDDLTVTVVFFGNESDLTRVDGQLEMNHDATRRPSPKL